MEGDDGFSFRLSHILFFGILVHIRHTVDILQKDIGFAYARHGCHAYGRAILSRRYIQTVGQRTYGGGIDVSCMISTYTAGFGSVTEIGHTL